ncbi:hypothetical protein cand_002690 [Cryptosporidium andersoni]|uniref:Uncharacterized protein n=1 Tax=Cryptosporidium andersoni TaxID=117008 RepID=A0A1J4MNU7_9CRYT|nr:hypothetical protein cand_002690 [Cryptosporidium andersoni]
MKLKLLVSLIGILKISSAILLNTKRYSYGEDLCGIEVKSVLKYIPDITDISSGSIVNCILDKEKFIVTNKGKTIQALDLDSINTPLLVTPRTDHCFSIVNNMNGKLLTLCGDTVGARNYIMKKITQNILCRHLGEMRSEISGISPLEQEARTALQGKMPGEGGISIHLEGMNEVPHIQVVSNSVLT